MASNPIHNRSPSALAAASTSKPTTCHATLRSAMAPKAVGPHSCPVAGRVPAAYPVVRPSVTVVCLRVLIALTLVTDERGPTASGPNWLLAGCLPCAALLRPCVLYLHPVSGLPVLAWSLLVHV